MLVVVVSSLSLLPVVVVHERGSDDLGWILRVRRHGFVYNRATSRYRKRGEGKRFVRERVYIPKTLVLHLDTDPLLFPSQRHHLPRLCCHQA